MSSTIRAQKRVPGFTRFMEVEAEVEITADDLHDEGWHHQSECTARGIPVPVAPVLASLHRQAHPSQPADVALCREEPCRSLSFAQVRAVTSHA